MKKKESEDITKKEDKFLKRQFIKHYRYTNKLDALNVLLKDDNYYTKKEVNDMLKEFYGGDLK